MKKAYETNDVDLFNEINNTYNLSLTSIEQVEEVENRLTFDLSRFYENWNGQYMKNYTTSRFILNFEPMHKHILKEPEIHIVSYSYMIFHVLNGLFENPNLDEVLENVELEIPNDTVKNLLKSGNFIKIDSDGTATVTQYGLIRLRGVNWVGFYDNFLDYFDFDDFEEYMKEYDTGDVMKNSLNYLDEHLKIALENREFHRLHDVFSSKAMVYINQKEFKNALMEELKIFVLKLNPVFLDDIDLKSYKPIEYPNINNIIELASLSQVKSLKRALYRAWLDVGFDDKIFTKKEAFNYLTRAIDGEVISDLADEILDKYDVTE